MNVHLRDRAEVRRAATWFVRLWPGSLVREATGCWRMHGPRGRRRLRWKIVFSLCEVLCHVSPAQMRAARWGGVCRSRPLLIAWPAPLVADRVWSEMGQRAAAFFGHLRRRLPHGVMAGMIMGMSALAAPDVTEQGAGELHAMRIARVQSLGQVTGPTGGSTPGAPGGATEGAGVNGEIGGEGGGHGQPNGGAPSGQTPGTQQFASLENFFTPGGLSQAGQGSSLPSELGEPGAESGEQISSPEAGPAGQGGGGGFGSGGFGGGGGGGGGAGGGGPGDTGPVDPPSTLEPPAPGLPGLPGSPGEPPSQTGPFEPGPFPALPPQLGETPVDPWTPPNTLTPGPPQLEPPRGAAPVPEPGAWMLMILGFGALGSMLRVQRQAGSRALRR